eukprot:1491094-Karenia_brevis.AAC.1
MGAASRDGLRQLACALTSNRETQSRFKCARDLLAALRVDVERTLAWSIADVTLASFGRAAPVR